MTSGPTRRTFLKVGSAAAWLLDGVADTVLFESGAALGGHAQTIPVVVDNQEIAVDVGAQFFAPGTHPTYEKLLEVLGLLDPTHPDEDATIEANMLAGAASLLEELEYFTADIVIHRDPVCMPPNGRYWSAYNATTDGGHCEGSIWYGALRRVPEGDAPLSLFKSWATARSEAPRDEVFRRTFRHPLITPAFIEGQRRLAAHQGRADVWFAGSYTKEVDSQETALTSAMNVVAHLAPPAPNLLRLQA